MINRPPDKPSAGQLAIGIPLLIVGVAGFIFLMTLLFGFRNAFIGGILDGLARLYLRLVGT
jgi:hypothetical protein